MPNHPSIIARPTHTGFHGRYVTNDGHPADRIPQLLHLYHRAYRHDLDAMLDFLIDQHPAGWSQIGTDPTADCGWINPCPPRGDRGFRCYCHGDRSEPEGLVTEVTADPLWDEWIYVLRPGGITVTAATPDGGAWLKPEFVAWSDGGGPCIAAA
ncbi:hypothetical protein AB0O91_21940 [Kitasatospora sp. NPDC089797]|uniref:hypothetical protein n=1 Tax=Kitasatospora sp. NPDC089797 TaxID=3155298 RepID=UPI003417B733